MKKVIILILIAFPLLANAQLKYSFQNPDLPLKERVNDLVSRLTLEEKVSQMINSAVAIPHLGIPAYNWWSEALHGVARAGIATVFPQAIGLGATFDTALVYKMAEVISTEARAKHHEFVRNGEYGQNQGLTFWSPNINIFRDPRWGRGQETYGEDPYLTARMGVNFVKGMQGDDQKYIKTIATPKHYAVHSGPESERHIFNAVTDQRDLLETYLPAFEAVVKEANAWSIMGAYNRFRGVPSCASPELLHDFLRVKWGFKGYVVSDCGAAYDIYGNHKYVETAEEAVAVAVKAGCDLNCGRAYSALVNAVEKGFITEDEIDVSVKRLFEARFRLGMFDPSDKVKYAQIPITENDKAEHRELALEIARKSIVLLKNKNNILPLKKDLKTIAVIGPNASNAQVMYGNYNGEPSYAVTPLQGIKDKLGKRAKIIFSEGCDLADMKPLVNPITPEWLKTENAKPGLKADRDIMKELYEISKQSDVVVFIGGLSPFVEGEAMDISFEGFKGGDRTSISLPKVQEKILKNITKAGKPVILVLMNGSALAVNWADENVDAIVEAWYPGEEGGTAIADILFGDYNPAGRLPVTFYKSVKDLPPFEDYNMKGRTYKYYEGETLYHFGYGLSYTTFEYSNLKMPESINAGENIKVSVDITNTGKMDGDEVIQLYITDKEHSVPAPIRSLQGFLRIHLKVGEKKTVEFMLYPKQMSIIDNEFKRVVEPGSFEISVGGRQPIPLKVSSSNYLTRVFNVSGRLYEVK